MNKITVDTKLQQMKQKDTKNLFKLKKFQTVAPRTNTYSKKGAFSQISQLQNLQNSEKKFEENQLMPSQKPVEEAQGLE